MASKKLYKLLLVDDDQIIRMIYQNFFANHFDIALASNGKEALQLLKIQNFDAVITDINMPEMSGIELTEAIRKLNAKNKNTVILGVTATPNSVRNKALLIGMDEVFGKPSDFSDIEKYLKESFAHQSKIAMI
jgi:CheY-like chemotaxis protein